MQIQFHLWGGGLAIPRTKIGATVLMGGSFSIRAAKGHTETTFLLGDLISLGGQNGTAIASSIKTKWFNVDPKTKGQEWITNCGSLLGPTLEIVLHGTVVNSGHVDLSFSKIDDDGIKEQLLSRHNLEATGGQLTETKIAAKVSRTTKGRSCYDQTNSIMT